MAVSVISRDTYLKRNLSIRPINETLPLQDPLGVEFFHNDPITTEHHGGN